MTKLADLNPQFWLSQGNETKGEFAFDCPVCGAPYRIVLPVHINGEPISPFRWGIAMPWLKTPGASPNWDSVTITPSIDNRRHGRKLCTWHGHVINGEIK